jgi:hypothetical protein
MMSLNSLPLICGKAYHAASFNNKFVVLSCALQQTIKPTWKLAQRRIRNTMFLAVGLKELP